MGTMEAGNYENYMRNALALAAEAAEAGEVPVGCVIVDGAGTIVGAGRNRREETRCVTGHAEMEAIEAACRARGDWRLSDCTLFVTLEPSARLGTLVYGAREPETGSAASVLNLFEERFSTGGHTAIYGGVCAAESRKLLKDFFDSRR